MSRHAWTKEEAQGVADLLRGTGDFHRNLPAVEAFLGFLPTRGQVEGALAGQLGLKIGPLLHERLAPSPLAATLPPPIPNVGTSAQVPTDWNLDWRGARPAMESVVDRRLVIGDLHVPAHNALALACSYEIARALQPKYIILSGDAANSAAFSHHGTHSPEVERQDLTMIAVRGVVRSYRRASPGSIIIIIRGNHDDWATRYEAENPGMQNMLDFEVQLGTKRAPDDDAPPMLEGVQVVRHAESNPLVIGPVAYIHGNGGGMHFCKRYAETIAPLHGVKTVVAGHHHTVQVFSAKNGCTAWGCGWLGNEEHPAFHYAPAPRGWRVGVLVQDVADDLVTTTFVPIQRGRATFGGRIISAALGG